MQPPADIWFKAHTLGAWEHQPQPAMINSNSNNNNNNNDNNKEQQLVNFVNILYFYGSYLAKKTNSSNQQC